MSITRSAIIQPEILLIDTFTESSDVDITLHTPDYNPAGNSWVTVSPFIGETKVIASSDTAKKTAANSDISVIDLGARPSKVKVKFKQAGTEKGDRAAILLRADSSGNGVLVWLSGFHTSNLLLNMSEVDLGVIGATIGSQVGGAGGDNLATLQEIIITDTGSAITVDATAAASDLTITAEATTAYSTNTGIGLADFSSFTTLEWDDLIAYA